MPGWTSAASAATPDPAANARVDLGGVGGTPALMGPELVGAEPLLSLPPAPPRGSRSTPSCCSDPHGRSMDLMTARESMAV